MQNLSKFSPLPRFLILYLLCIILKYPLRSMVSLSLFYSEEFFKTSPLHGVLMLPLLPRLHLKFSPIFHVLIFPFLCTFYQLFSDIWWLEWIQNFHTPHHHTSLLVDSTIIIFLFHTHFWTWDRLGGYFTFLVTLNFYILLKANKTLCWNHLVILILIPTTML